MSDAGATVLDVALALHRGRAPHAAFRMMLDRLAPRFGPALALCYLRDHAAGEFRLTTAEDTERRWTPATLTTTFGIPATLAHAVVAPVLERLAALGEPVEIGRRAGDALAGIWPSAAAAALQDALGGGWVVAAPVATEQGPEGLFVLCVGPAWPAEVALACSLHAATATGNLIAYRGMAQQAADLFMRSVISHVAEREIDRARRYKRTLSVAVIEPAAADASSARLIEASALVARVMRLPDTAGRLDQRHVVVLLPETPPEGAAAFLRRLRAEAGPEGDMLRGGAATFPGDGETWDSLVRLALDRLEGAEDEPEPEPPLPPPDLVPVRAGPAAPSVAGRAERAPLAGAAPEPVSSRVAARAGVSARVVVAMVEEADVPQWLSLVRRLPSVTAVQLERYDAGVATIDVEVASISRLLAQLGHLAEKVGATLNPSITGEIGLTLRPPGGRRRRPLAESQRT